MPLPKLSKLSDAEYKMLRPEELRMYNVDMPEHDYANPYIHKPFPKAMFSFVGSVEAGGRLSVVKVENDKELKALQRTGDWRESPADWGIETCPGAPPFDISTQDYEVPPKPEYAVAPAGA